tara:strand:- start:1103 stop:1831 length:729 start_codon:yes stop_codon:yes gene_type:complete
MVKNDYGYYFSKKNGLYEFIEGKKIKVNYFYNIDNDLLQILLNYPIGAILYQKNYYVMHASSVKFDNKIICFCGQSMSGKSSLVAKLISEGGKLISEDTSIFSFTNKDILIHPSYPFIKISNEVKNFTDLSTSTKVNFKKKINNRPGFILNPNQFEEKTKIVDAFIFLTWGDGKELISRVSAKESLTLLLSNNFFNTFSNDQLVMIFNRSSFISRRCSFFQYNRKKDFNNLNSFIPKLRQYL